MHHHYRNMAEHIQAVLSTPLATGEFARLILGHVQVCIAATSVETRFCKTSTCKHHLNTQERFPSLLIV